MDLREWPLEGPLVEIGKKKVKNFQEVLTMEESHMRLKEKLSTYFDNHASVETHYSHPARKESHRCQEEHN